MAMATGGPIMDMDMGVAGVTKRGPATSTDLLFAGFNKKPVMTSARSHSATGISPLAERNTARPTARVGSLYGAYELN